MENTFGSILKSIRTEKGVSQESLAEGIGVSKGVISLWEHELREPKLSNLVALAKYFAVSIDFLAGLKEF